jgi:hypothetical protein
VSGVIDHAGVIARYVDDSNMVYGGIITATTAEIWNRIGGTWTQLGSTWTIPDVSTGWHTQELRVAGDQVNLYIDGTFVGSATLMPGAPAAGKTGFWSQYGPQEGYRDDHVVLALHSIAGTVFEDADFAGTASAYNAVNDKALAGVDVELYDGGPTLTSHRRPRPETAVSASPASSAAATRCGFARRRSVAARRHRREG